MDAAGDGVRSVRFDDHSPTVKRQLADRFSSDRADVPMRRTAPSRASRRYSWEWYLACAATPRTSYSSQRQPWTPTPRRPEFLLDLDAGPALYGPRGRLSAAAAVAHGGLGKRASVSANASRNTVPRRAQGQHVSERAHPSKDL